MVVVAAFRRATGEQMNRLFEITSRGDSISRIYARIERLSNKLREWLDMYLPKLEQLEKERSDLKKDPAKKDGAAAIEKQLSTDPDLVALQTLIKAYGGPTVRAWRAYGIVTIPREVIESFMKLGRSKGARWGGEYEHTKDVMHLELLKFDPGKDEWPNKPRKRNPVQGFDDLCPPDANPVPVNGP